VTRTLVFVVGLSLASAEVASAQIIQGGIGGGDPIAWTSLSIGWMNHGALCDAESAACWSFGSAPQWRATLDVPMGRGASIGAAATTARVPLIYQGSALAPNSCTSCDADANVTQYLGHVHIGGGSSFYQVIDVSAGMTVFSNFRSTSGTRLGGKAVSDFSFAVGYGFGYSVSPRTQIMLVQEYGLVIGKRQSGTTNNTAQQTTTRFGVRFGLGEGRR
jgi:hypothetical protein